jgi:cation:H+ antiporter
MGSFSTPILLLVFAAGAAATWVAGLYLSKTTDALDDRLHLGEALGGMILLAIAGSLPEVAITVSGALQGHLDIVAGNLIGGIAMQTAVLVICDLVVGSEHPLSTLVGSLMPVLEAVLVVSVVSLVLLGALLPASVAVAGVSPASLLIVLVWLLGMLVLNKVRKAPRWKAEAPGSSPGRPHRRVPHPTAPRPFVGASTGRVVVVFAAGSVVTLLAGAALEISGSELAARYHVSGIVFGATILALASALPEISTGVAAIRLGDNELAMGDIFGGNAFQVCLFLLADLIAGQPVLPSAGAANSWLGGVGIVLTTVYAASVVVRPRRCYARLGPDSIAVLVFFALGLAGLAVIAK